MVEKEGASKIPVVFTPKLQIIQVVKVLGLSGLVLFIFNKIIHSESYAYQSMDSLPLGLLELFTFLPVTIFSLVLSIRSAKRFYNVKNIALSATCIIVAFSITAVFFFGFGAYESFLKNKVKKMNTEALLRTRGQYLGQHWTKVFDTRKSDLYFLLSDAKNADIEERILYYLRKEKDEKLIPRYKNLAEKILDGKITSMTIYSLHLPIMELRRQQSGESQKALMEIQQYAKSRGIEDKILLSYLDRAVNESWSSIVAQVV